MTECHDGHTSRHGGLFAKGHREDEYVLTKDTTQELNVAFELGRLRRWVKMLTELDSIVAAFPSDVLDDRRKLLNRIIFNQCAYLSRHGQSAEVEFMVAGYRNNSQKLLITKEYRD